MSEYETYRISRKKSLEIAQKAGKNVKNWQTEHKAYDIKPGKKKMKFGDAAEILRQLASDNRRHFADDTVEALLLGAKALEG